MIHDNSHWEIPSSVDLEGFLEKYPPDFKYKKDHFYFIVEYLAKGMEQGDLDQNIGFINTSSVKLQSRIKNYKQYLDHMLEHGFIRTDMEYIPGVKSKGYLLSGRNKEDTTINLIPIEGSVAKKNRAKENRERLAKNKKTERDYPHLTQWFNEKLRMDVRKAKMKLNELFPVQTGGIRGTRKGKPSDYSKRVKAIYSIDKIEKQNFYYSVDDNVGRFHSNLTNIKKELRNFITYDGKSLVNVDIRNSQPFFSTLVLHPAFYEEKSENINIYNFPSSFSLLSSTSPPNISPFIVIMLGKTTEIIDNEEFKEYSNLVNSGEFYKRLHSKLYSQLPYDKEKMKDLSFVIFYSNNRFIGQPEAQEKRDFRDAFPKVYEVFKKIKTKNHSALSHVLQRIESEIVIQRVSKRIAKEKPELPIFTVHDSVATIKGYEDYVSDVIKDEVLKATGLKVKLGLEYWEENPGS